MNTMPITDAVRLAKKRAREIGTAWAVELDPHHWVVFDTYTPSAANYGLAKFECQPDGTLKEEWA